MVFIDSHCHLHDSRIISDIQSLSSRATDNNVKKMVTCATMEENFEITAQLSKIYPSVLPCFGIHPWFIEGVSDQWKNNLETYLESHLSGVGETGIDFTDKTADRDKQIQVFEYHLGLAKDLGRPINIHVRKAWDTFIHIIKRFGKFKVPGLIHSYSGSADMIPLFERFGLYISFSGSVTNPSSKKVKKALAVVSEDRFVLETDSPDIYPYLTNGDNDENNGKNNNGKNNNDRYNKLNEPKNLPAIAKIASQEINRPYDVFCQNAYENSKQLFDPIIEG
jgi:TatD DNase family protein